MVSQVQNHYPSIDVKVTGSLLKKNKKTHDCLFKGRVRLVETLL